MDFPNVRKWLKNGQRGLSSEAIVQHLTGFPLSSERDETFHPRDPSDLSRCRLLLQQCPELVPLFPKMAGLSPQWAALVANWDDLCRMMDEEAPQWAQGRGSARKTYDRMQELTEPS